MSTEIPVSPPSLSPSVPRRPRAERLDALYKRIVQLLGRRKRFAAPAYTAGDLAAELGVAPADVSAAVARGSGGNFCSLLSGLRLAEARRLLRDPRYAALTAEEVGLMAGFASRQAFYKAFVRRVGTTPARYRREEAAAEPQERKSICQKP